jgi:hypothetical protein
VVEIYIDQSTARLTQDEPEAVLLGEGIGHRFLVVPAVRPACAAWPLGAALDRNGLIATL